MERIVPLPRTAALDAVEVKGMGETPNFYWGGV